MNGISGLENSFAVSFGLTGERTYTTENRGRIIKTVLVLSVDEFHQQYISEDEAKEIFDLVTKAFMMGCKAEHHYQGATYEFDRENLTVIETIDRDCPHRGEWL